MESRFYPYEDCTLHYYVHGNGPKTLLCFHGYGQDAHYFKSLSERLSSRYTLYSFDLFYHGESVWSDCEKAVEQSFFAEMIDLWVQSLQISNISLCGYSMGGKIALSLVEHLNVSIEKILLIAPDGIQTNFWYSLATYPYWARNLFKYTIHHPAFFLRALNTLHQLGLVEKGVIRFAKLQMNSDEKRRKVYCTWLTYRKIKPNISQIAKKVNNNNMDLSVYLGKYDKIITQKSVNPLIEQVKNYTLLILDRGHNNLIEDVAKVDDLNF